MRFLTMKQTLLVLITPALHTGCSDGYSFALCAVDIYATYIGSGQKGCTGTTTINI